MAFDIVQINTSLVDPKLIKKTLDHNGTSKSWRDFPVYIPNLLLAR